MNEKRQDFDQTFQREVAEIEKNEHRQILLMVAKNIDAYVKWPKNAQLLWEGCDRKKVVKGQQRYHAYPKDLKTQFPNHKFGDRRCNGPAINSFLIAGGVRPSRTSGRGWNIHHLYDGKYPKRLDSAFPSLHAVQHPLHFTQSAGLVAVHPIADSLADEFSAFAWRLREESYLRFGYDPDGVFCRARNQYGFKVNSSLKIWHVATI